MRTVIKLSNHKKIVALVPPPIALTAAQEMKKRRVVAYARVSTDKSEQLQSFEAQLDYFVTYIAEHADWVYCGIYSDEAITGTSTKSRDGFNRMMADALADKFDLIITKSISRFARNTVDTLTNVRKLKAVGVEVYFQKENMWSLDSKSEFVLTLMSSMAQEESRSISENITWGIYKRAADGQVTVAYAHFLGYDKGKEKGELVINEEQAVTVRLIYRLFIEGMTAASIANRLTELGIPTPAGKKRWQCTVVESILSNEKYKGDALRLKSFTADYLTKKIQVNHGERPQYYISENHLPIIEPVLFDYIQELIPERKVRQFCVCHTFSGMILCGECGNCYGAKRWHSTSYNDLVWQCNHRYEQAEKCKTPHLYDQVLRYAFNATMLHLLGSRPEIIEDCRDYLSAAIRGKKKNARKAEIIRFCDSFLMRSPLDITDDETAWAVLVRQVTVKVDRSLIFRFIDGSEFELQLPDFSPRYRNSLMEVRGKCTKDF